MLYTLSSNCFPYRFRPNEDTDTEQRKSYVFPTLVDYFKEVVPSFEFVKIKSFDEVLMKFTVDIEYTELLDYLEEWVDNKLPENFSYVDDSLYAWKEEWEYIDADDFDDIDYIKYEDLNVTEAKSVEWILWYYIDKRFEWFDTRDEICNVPID